MWASCVASDDREIVHERPMSLTIEPLRLELLWYASTISFAPVLISPYKDETISKLQKDSAFSLPKQLAKLQKGDGLSGEP